MHEERRRSLSLEPPLDSHQPVLLEEILTYLAPTGSETYVDGTYGRGGTSRALLEAAPRCCVLALDRDEAAIQRGQSMMQEYAGRFKVFHARFSNLLEVLQEEKVQSLEGLVLDLGVSSPQLDQAERGFSFQQEGPLDMRMGLSALTAAEVVNTFKEEDLAHLFYTYGEERLSRRIARQIVASRVEKPFRTTLELAAAVAKAMPKKASASKIHPATRVFQALRIYVNEELKELEEILEVSEEVLAPGGRIVVVSFHSLEDRRVKTFFQEKAGRKESVSRHRPEGPPPKEPTFEILTKKVVTATAQEQKGNPRASSAKLRAARRL